MVSLDSSQCLLSAHVVCVCILTNCKLLDALEWNKSGAVLGVELLPQAQRVCEW